MAQAFGTTIFPSQFDRSQLSKKFNSESRLGKAGHHLVVPRTYDVRRQIAPINEAATKSGRGWLSREQ